MAKRIAAEGSGLVDRPQRRKHIHEAAFAAEDADGKAAADDFAQRHEVGIERIKLARAAECDTETGHDFVDDEQRALICGEGAQTGEIARGRRNAAGIADDGLDDDGGNLAGMRGKSGFNGAQIVVGQSEGKVCDLVRHACRSRNAKCRDAGAGFDQKAVGVAVIAALEFDDELAAGGGAGQADSGHRRLSAGADETHFFDGRIAAGDALGEIGLRCRGGAEAGRVARGALNGFDNRRERVAQNHRSPGAEVVDVAIAVGVVEGCALGALDEGRRAADGAKGADRRVDAAGEEALGALLQDLGSGANGHCGSSIEGGRLQQRGLTLWTVGADAHQHDERGNLQHKTQAHAESVEEIVLRG